MNNKAAQKAVPYVIATTDTQNWLTTKLPQFCPLQPPLFFQRCKIISKLQESHSYALQKNEAKVNEASKCFPVWQQSSFKDTSLTRVMPNDDRWEQYEYTLHRLYVHTSKPIQNSSFSLQNTLYPLLFARWVGGQA